MKVLSLFDGISGAQQALKNLGIIPDKYYASEIDKYAISITMKNFPNTIQLGDVRNINKEIIGDIDLLVGGSPCTSFSCAARQKESGLEKGESQLFWEYLRVLKEINPKYFLLENVASMKKIDKEKITKLLGVPYITINSNLVTAQNRARLYWTNIPNIKQPNDLNILLKDIIDYGYTEKNKSYCITATYDRACIPDYIEHKQRQLIFKDKEACCLTYGRSEAGKKARQEFKDQFGYDGGPRDSKYREWVEKIDNKCITLTSSVPKIKIKPDGLVRKLSPEECEKLQSFPVGYTNYISSSQRYKCLGNSFTVKVIEHILKNMEINNE